MVDAWSCGDVCDWLVRHGFQEYAPQFQAQGITGRELLRLTPTEIRCALGVASLQHRKDLYASILRLREGLGEPRASGASGTYHPNSRMRSPAEQDAGWQYGFAPPAEEYPPRPTGFDAQPSGNEWWVGDRSRGQPFPPEPAPRPEAPLQRTFSGSNFPQHRPRNSFDASSAHRLHDGRNPAAVIWPRQWDTGAGGAGGSLSRTQPLNPDALSSFPVSAMPQRPPAQPQSVVDAQLEQLELLAADLAAIEDRVNQLQGSLGPEYLGEIQSLLQTMDSIILLLDPLGPTDLWVQYGEVVRVQRRLLLQRADILKQRLVLLRHTCQLRGKGFGGMSPSKAQSPSAPWPAATPTPVSSGPPPHGPHSPNCGMNSPPQSRGCTEKALPQSDNEEAEERATEGSQTRLSRSYSSRSTTAMETLLLLGRELAGYEQRSRELLPEARDELAALFGKVELLLLHSIDAVATADLCTGKEDARAERRALVQRAEALLTFLSGLRRDGSAEEVDEVPTVEAADRPNSGDRPTSSTLDGSGLEVDSDSAEAMHMAATAEDFDRQYSTKSISILQRIDELKAEVDGLEGVIAGFTPGDPCHKDEIAQLFGRVERLLLQRIDGVLCHDLQSGQQDAKAARRSLVGRCNTLLDRLVELKGLL